MRIAHTCLRYPPATGGVETYVHQLATRSKAHGIDVRVLTSKLRTHGPLSELDPEPLLDDKPYVQRLHHTTTPFVSYPRLQALTHYLAHHQPSIVHGHSFWYQPADVAARYAKQNKLPFVFSPYYYENEVRRKPLWQLYMQTYGRATFAAADVVVVISPFEQQLIEQAGYPVKRFELLPPGVEAEAVGHLQENPFKALSIAGPVILTVSRLSESKGLNDAIAAVPAIQKEVPDAQLVIVGEDFGAKASLKNQAGQLGISEHVHFLGKLSAEELIGAYHHADVFLHTSHYEAFGIVLAEALAAGTPVVARDVGAVSYVAPHAKAGLLFKTKEGLTRNVVTLLSDKNQRTQFAEAGKKHVREHFSWDTTIKKLTELYSELSQ